MDEIYSLIGKLYLDLYQYQKMIEVQEKKIKDLTEKLDKHNESK
jgi:hypothetical protein